MDSCNIVSDLIAMRGIKLYSFIAAIAERMLQGAFSSGIKLSAVSL